MKGTLTLTKSLAKRNLGRTVKKMETIGAAEMINWLTRSMSIIRPGVHQQEMNDLLGICEQINDGQAFYEIEPVGRIQTVQNMVSSAMPTLLRCVRNTHPLLVDRLEQIDWRQIFDLPEQPVAVNIIPPSDEDSGTSSVS